MFLRNFNFSSSHFQAFDNLLKFVNDKRNYAQIEMELSQRNTQVNLWDLLFDMFILGALRGETLGLCGPHILMKK